MVFALATVHARGLDQGCSPTAAFGLVYHVMLRFCCVYAVCTLMTSLPQCFL